MCKDYIDPTGHFLGSLFAWVGKVVIGGVVNAVVDTGVRLLTGQEVSLKTIGSSFVEGCVVSATGSAAAKLVGKAVGAVKNTKTAAKIASATTKVKDKTAGLASKAIEKVKASRAASKAATIKYSQRNAVSQISKMKNKTAMIGKMKDLKWKKTTKSSYKVANYLAPFKGNPKVAWKNNSGILRTVMKNGRPIKDVSRMPYRGYAGFLGMERNLLKNHGWTYRNKYWYPPKR